MSARRKRVVTLAAALVLTFACIGIAVAAPPLSQHASTVDRRAIPPDHSVGWDKLSPGLQKWLRARWNQRGPAGRQGEPGEPGPQGPPGKAGESPEGEPEAGSGFIRSQSVSLIGGSSAILEAVLSTEDAPAGIWYQFQIAPDPARFRPEVSCPEIPIPAIGCSGSYLHGGQINFVRQAGDMPTRHLWAGPDRQRVRLEVEGLSPLTEYHFRVVVVEAVQTVDTVEWLPGPSYGEARSFITPDLAQLSPSPS